MSHYDTIILDLDGTLVDSAPGITQSIAHTLRDMDLPVPSMSELLHWVGPPLPQSFRDKMGLSPGDVDRAISIYRERYLNVGAYDSKLFDGIGHLLRDLRDDGRQLAIATSKPRTPATLMLEHFTLVPFFNVIAAAADDESRGEKHLIIGDALHELNGSVSDLGRAVMVGDRIHDVDGAATHGLDSVAVQWGYGTPDEWSAATHQASTPRQLRSLLGLPAPRAGIPLLGQ